MKNKIFIPLFTKKKNYLHFTSNLTPAFILDNKSDNKYSAYKLLLPLS